MGSIMKHFIVMLTVAVAVVLSSSSDNGQKNKELKNADGLGVQDRSESREDYARGELEQNKRSAGRTLEICVDTRCYSNKLSVPVSVRFVSCSGQLGSFQDFLDTPRLPLNPETTFCRDINADDIGTEFSGIELQMHEDGEWIPFRFRVIDRDNTPYTHTECMWVPHDGCPLSVFTVRRGNTIIFCESR